MRRMMRILSVLLTAVLVLGCIPSAPVRAAEGGYTYTVRFYSGQQGTIGGGEVLEFTNLQYGDRVTFNQNTVALLDGSKYYIRGIRESGKDNNTIGAVSFLVTGDQDYVVAYGLLGSAVAYTINYVDAAGNELAPSETYYGNVGDKPVIAFLYIEGYQPQAYNLTKTLSENAAENVFTFVYTPITVPEPPAATARPATTTPSVLPSEGNPAADTPDGDAGDVPAPGGDDGNPAPDGNDGNPVPDGGDDGQGEDGQDEDDQDEDGNTDIDENETPQGGPQETVDLDEQEVPLGDFGLNLMSDTRVALALRIAAVVLVVAAVAGVSIWYRKKRRKREQNEQ